ncbi:hypothetical protein B296_00011308 [Ensete ventricosum]|uniref:Survival protein SurE-like phosphatase/nucleotidase domain-containing protein n=1 Tax=Ensete ventricosum TaxID=4639 RepID=A0A427AMP2_ENSVE|nr:hypothetical protein B296_00011308 [Ensete ventricosum]
MGQSERNTIGVGEDSRSQQGKAAAMRDHTSRKGIYSRTPLSTRRFTYPKHGTTHSGALGTLTWQEWPIWHRSDRPNARMADLAQAWPALRRPNRIMLTSRPRRKFQQYRLLPALLNASHMLTWVISGINIGGNCGYHMLMVRGLEFKIRDFPLLLAVVVSFICRVYSGTVAAAREAFLYGVPALSISYNWYDRTLIIWLLNSY